jgi:hypothetical protein
MQVQKLRSFQEIHRDAPEVVDAVIRMLDDLGD